jgi:hypothetical protein
MAHGWHETLDFDRRQSLTSSDVLAGRSARRDYRRTSETCTQLLTVNISDLIETGQALCD